MPNKEKVCDAVKSTCGTRVYKKSSPNAKITCYVGKRDLFCSWDRSNFLDGAILIDPEYIQRKQPVFALISAIFRYGRDDLDLLGLSFKKNLFSQHIQIFPPSENELRHLSPLQFRLLRKLGANAFPFRFEIPLNAPLSVVLFPLSTDSGKPCGVDFELRVFASGSFNEEAQKRNQVRLAIRRLISASPSVKPRYQPFAEVTKEFLMSPAPLHMECSLDKDIYFHDEPVNVNVTITNDSNRTIKRIRITVRQYSQICLFSTARYKCTVAELDSHEGFPLLPCTNLSRVYTLVPKVIADKRGLALDGRLKYLSPCLASSTPLSVMDNKDNMGILVHYKVKIHLYASMHGDVSVDLPLVLTHPYVNNTERVVPKHSTTDKVSASTNEESINLMEFEDDLFEEFARNRLKVNC